jgi:hypothetical protein
MRMKQVINKPDSNLQHFSQKLKRMKGGQKQLNKRIYMSCVPAENCYFSDL